MNSSTTANPTHTAQPDVWRAAANGEAAAVRQARRHWAAVLARTDDIAALHSMAKPDPSGAGGWRYDALGIACELSGLGEWLENNGQRYYLVDRMIGLHGAIDGYATGYVDTPTRIEIAHGRLPDAVRLAVGLRTATGEFRLTAEWLAQCQADIPDLANSLRVIVPTSYAPDAWQAVVSAAEAVAAPDAWKVVACSATAVYIGTSLAILNDMGLTLPMLSAIVVNPPPGLLATWQV